MIATKPLKPRACKCCKAAFTPTRPMQVVCGQMCGLERARLKREAQERKQAAERAKLDRMMDAQRRQALRTTSKLEEDCRKIVQKIARLRDRNDPCISCDKPASWQGQWHGSHFRSHGACSALQFHLWNIHKACWICNKLYSGRIGDYEPRLIEKMGGDRVDWLKSQNQVVKSDRAYLLRFKKVMGKRLRRMEKRNG